MHGRRGTAPRLNDAGEVLGAADLQLGVERQCRARSVGSCAPLTPVGAGHEVHRLGFATRYRVALDPQQRAVRRGHGDHHTGVGGVLDQQPTDDGKRRRQRVGSAHVVERDGDGCGMGCTDVGVDARGPAAPPARGDDGPQRGGVQVRVIHLTRHEEFMKGAQIRQPSRSPAAP